MNGRGGGPWIVLENGTLEIRYSDEPRALPPKDDVADNFRYSYFLGSMKAILAGGFGPARRGTVAGGMSQRSRFSPRLLRLPSAAAGSKRASFSTFEFDPEFFEMHVLPLLFDRAFSVGKVRLAQLEDEMRHLPHLAVYFD